MLEILNHCNNRQTLGFWAKSGKTMVARAAVGLLGMLPEALPLCDKRGQQAPAQVLPDLQGKGQEQ